MSQGHESSAEMSAARLNQGKSNQSPRLETVRGRMEIVFTDAGNAIGRRIKVDQAQRGAKVAEAQAGEVGQ